MTNFYKEIQEKASILQVIGSYIALKRKGKGYAGLCPFHDDNHPSLHIDLTKQIYKCFSCGAGGNVVKFVKEFEGISFLNAAKKVIDICGLNIEIKTFNIEKPKENTTHKILKNARDFYSYLLVQKNNNPGFIWLKERGLTNEIIEQFNLGWSPNKWDDLTKYLFSKNFSKVDILKTNLTIINQNDALVDFFRERIIYPLEDMYGLVVGFIGRIIEKNIDQPKFLVLSNTSLFNKGDHLYNIHEIYKNKFNEIILVEGMHDVITLYEKGIKNVLGLLGTTLTNNHLLLLHKLNIKTILLLLDGDAPGKEATSKIKQILLDNKISVKILKNQISSDPDEFFRFKTRIEIKKYLKDYELYNSNINTPAKSIDETLINTFEKDNKKNSSISRMLVSEKYLLQAILHDREKDKLLSFYLGYGGEMVSKIAKEIGDYLLFLYIINLHKEQNNHIIKKLSYYMLSNEAKQELNQLVESEYLKINDGSFNELVKQIKNELKRKVVKKKNLKNLIK